LFEVQDGDDLADYLQHDDINNILQVDTDGSTNGTDWVTFATFSPTTPGAGTMNVVYEDAVLGQQNAII
jgi:hypothetical protein